MANQNVLQGVIDEIETLISDRKEIDAAIKEVKERAKKAGFSLKMLNRVLKRRTMTDEERDEEDALLQIYEGSLGMLNGTPLGEAALRRLTKDFRAERRGDDDDHGGEGGSDVSTGLGGDAFAAPDTPPRSDQDPEEEGYARDTIDEARAKGASAAQAGVPVTNNPYPPRTPQRAAWDEAWCQAAGSDGMDIPAAWKPSPRPRKGAAEPDAGDGASA